jgi:hypothetical protein
MMVPTGFLFITNVFAPRHQKHFFAMADALPLEQSNPTFLSLKERVAIEIKYPI